MSDAVALTGADGFIDAVSTAALELANLTTAHDEAGALIAARARPPRKTGYLASTLGYLVTTAGVTVTASAPYAAATEARDPWMDRTVQEVTPELVTIYTDAVTDAVANIKGA